jgi:hypothetical protein
VHQELHTPDSTRCGVRSWFDVPGRELFRERPYPGPVSGASEVDGLRGGGAESGYLRGGEEGWDENETITVEGLEVVLFRGHGYGF